MPDTYIHRWHRPVTDEEMRAAVAQGIAQYGNCGPYCTGDCQVDGAGQACLPEWLAALPATTEGEHPMTDTHAIDETAQHLYERGEGAESFALTLIRCLDYDHSLLLDDAAYRAAVRTILDAAEKAVLRRLDDLQAASERARIHLAQLHHSPEGAPDDLK